MVSSLSPSWFPLFPHHGFLSFPIMVSSLPGEDVGYWFKYHGWIVGYWFNNHSNWGNNWTMVRSAAADVIFNHNCILLVIEVKNHGDWAMICTAAADVIFTTTALLVIVLITTVIELWFVQLLLMSFWACGNLAWVTARKWVKNVDARQNFGPSHESGTKMLMIVYLETKMFIIHLTLMLVTTSASRNSNSKYWYTHPVSTT